MRAATARSAALERIARAGRPGARRLTLWHEVTEIVGARGPALHVALLVHARPGVAADDEPLPPGDAGAPARVAREGVLPAGRARPDERRALGSGVSTHPRGHRRRSQPSPRWQANMEMGGDQELLVALRTRAGTRGASRPLPGAGRAACSTRRRSASSPRPARRWREGARRALLLGEARDPEGPDSPGLLVLSARASVESSTAGRGALVSELPGGRLGADGRLPPSVLSVAAQALRTAEGADAPGEVAVARVLSDSGHAGWCSTARRSWRAAPPGRP